MASSPAAPTVPFRHPPGASQTSESDIPTQNTAATIAAAVSLPSPTGGSASVGAGDGDGGGPQGVPDGLPVPSKRNRMPDYPRSVREKGWTGVVLLELIVNESGRVTAVRVLESSGHAVLDDAAVTAARTWSYTPATDHGRPVPFRSEFPVRFELHKR